MWFPFGAAPAILSWHWGLSNFGSQGLFCCFVFCACGTIRLARFNVLASAGAGTSDFFLGLPITCGCRRFGCGDDDNDSHGLSTNEYRRLDLWAGFGVVVPDDFQCQI